MKKMPGIYKYIKGSVFRYGTFFMTSLNLARPNHFRARCARSMRTRCARDTQGSSPINVRKHHPRKYFSETVLQCASRGSNPGHAD